jgi:hypothetical protein
MYLSRLSPHSIYSVVLVALLVCAAALVVRLHYSSPLTKTYTNSTYRFSLRMPADYSAAEIPSQNSQMDLIELTDQSHVAESPGLMAWSPCR